jgi:hypothetical protein
VTRQFCDPEREGAWRNVHICCECSWAEPAAAESRILVRFTEPEDSAAKGIVIFGGVNATQDLNDAWLLRPTQRLL